MRDDYVLGESYPRLDRKVRRCPRCDGQLVIVRDSPVRGGLSARGEIRECKRCGQRYAEN